MALHLQHDPVTARPAAQGAEGLVERRLRPLVGGHMVDRGPAQLLQPEIRAGVETDHLHALREKGEEGEEEGAVQPALVEAAGLDVGGRDHHDPVGEQRREQPAEDHGVGDVGDGELVEA